MTIVLAVSFTFIYAGSIPKNKPKVSHFVSKKKKMASSSFDAIY